MARLPRIPDLLTTANLCCGVGSILLASQGQLTWACWLVFAGALFDVFDGLAARALGGGTPLGAQLDSLADMVTFGVAPAFLIWEMMNLPSSAPDQYFFLAASTSDGPMNIGGKPVQMFYRSSPLPVLIIAICSAWRLAKFNIDTRQTHGFLGLPTPANALFWASIPLAIATDWGILNPFDGSIRLFLLLLFSTPLITVIAAILGALMLSEIPLPSLKFKHFGWKGNEVIYLLLGIGAVLVVLYGILAVPLILVLYLLSPLWGRLFPKAVA